MPDDVPAPGTVVAGKYEVERLLGTGGMGVVVAARHRLLGQQVAIKFMRASAALDANAVERFLREARAAVALSSEHVARVYDVATLDSGAPYIVMEYLSGADLGQLIRRDGPMAFPTAVGLILQACEALAEAHRLGIVHRDLKPANLFLARRGDESTLVKVLDFGISKAADLTGREGQGGLTASGIIMGSPNYMSPEQVRSTRGVDARSDIWSLGVILYELISGISPFEGETLGDTFAKITSEAPRPLRERRPDLPAGLDAVIHHCLERKVSARVQSIAELASRLAPFASPDGKLSAERISRASRYVGGVTLMAPESKSVGGDTGLAPSGTEKPWLRSAGARRPAAPSPRWLPFAVGGALVLAAAAFGVHRAGSRPPQVASVPAVAPSAPPVAATVAPLESSPETASTATSPRETVNPPAPSASIPTHPADRPGSPRPLVRPALPAASMASAKTPASAPRSSDPKVPAAGPDPLRCTPPYVIDAAGHREYKPECL